MQNTGGGGTRPLAQTATVTPRILLGGANGTDITGTMQSVVVGQQIALYASYGSGVSVNSQSWSVPGTVPTNYVGGFNHTLTSGGYTQPTLNQQSTTFYWVTDSGWTGHIPDRTDREVP